MCASLSDVLCCAGGITMGTITLWDIWREKSSLADLVNCEGRGKQSEEIETEAFTYDTEQA